MTLIIPCYLLLSIFVYIDIQTLSHVFIKFLSLHEMDALTRD